MLADYEVRSVIKFLKVQNIALISIHRLLCQVYEPNVMNKQMVHRWCRQFTVGRQHVHEEEYNGKPSIIMDNLVKFVRNASWRIVASQLLW